MAITNEPRIQSIIRIQGFQADIRPSPIRNTEYNADIVFLQLVDSVSFPDGIGFNADPDPAFWLNADSDLYPDPKSQTKVDPYPDPGQTLKSQTS